MDVDETGIDNSYYQALFEEDECDELQCRAVRSAIAHQTVLWVDPIFRHERPARPECHAQQEPQEDSNRETDHVVEVCLPADEETQARKKADVKLR